MSEVKNVLKVSNFSRACSFGGGGGGGGEGRGERDIDTRLTGLGTDRE